ncbi:MAG: T9SS type A sorting domain-containing protein [Phaeodactylibacter sp.]|uniref:T9SS type A sorting domain-containing protein n=1 Tax=Phaeodactylibacter sp. TaxID=1940289 RepID=UPI0032EDCEF3
MKLLTKVLLLVLLGQVSLNAQLFNIAEDLGYVSNHFERVIVHNDTIACIGFAQNDSLQQGIAVVLYDSTGQRLTSRLLLDDEGERLMIYRKAGGISPANHGGYIVIAYASGNAIFFKLDENLNEEFRHQYTNDGDGGNYNYYAPIPLGDGYLIYGYIYRPNGEPDPFVRIVDEQGQTLRLNFYGEYEMNDIYQDAQLLGDSILVAGGQRRSSQGSGYSKNFFHRIRLSDGALLDSWESPINPDMGWLRQFVVLEDGDIITFGQQPLEIIDGNTFIVQPMLTRLNSNYETVWQQPIWRSGYHIQGDGLYEIQQVSDGYFVGSGHLSTEINGNWTQAGWLFKFTAFGDSLWSRYYLPPFELQGNPLVGGNFFNFGELSSGHLVSGGTASGDSPRRCWVVKTDANGCQGETPCEVLTGVVEEEPLEEPGMRVFPNPTQGTLQVVLPQGANQASLILYNLQGQPAFQSVLTGQRTTLQLPVPTGIYWARLQIAGQQPEYHKIIVSR